ncbi:MAG: 3-oxoacyl-ACP synthase III [Nocardioidaceae bacterium]|nr:3-oxoacyl-ACP synthase III [Nocardioidaceae bacterium]
MSGNGVHRSSSTSVLAVAAVDAQQVVTSAEFDEQLASTYARTGLRPGLLEGLVGIRERRWWADGMTYSDGAAMAGAKALAEAGINPADVGVMINTSVSRAHLEPSSAVSIHDALGLPTRCLNFDVANACLGFVNGMQIADAMIESGQIDYALVVNGEDARAIHETTLARLSGPTITASEFMSEFATLTLGSGAAAMVLGRGDRHPEGHRIIGGVSRASTQHHELCVGGIEMMRTDSRGLLEAGLQLAGDLWDDARADFDWATGMDRYVIHQISDVHTNAMCRQLGIDPAQVPRTFPTRGNIGPASIPYTLAVEAQELQAGDRVLLMGIGSGLNANFTEICW